VYAMNLPTHFVTPNLGRLNPNDTIPSSIDPSSISYLGEFFPATLTLLLSNPRTTVSWDDDGKGISLDYAEQDQPDQEWMTIETVLLRINTRYTHSGRFPVYLNKSLPTGFDIRIGYDAAVCALKYEPWIVEAYNTSTGSPSALRIVGKGDGSTSLLPIGDIQGPPITNTRYLNKTGKGVAYNSARGNGVYQIVKDDGLDSYYPSPIVGPIMPPCTTFLLTSIYSAGRFFHRWRRT